MFVSLHNQLRRPSRLQATRCVLEDQHGNIIGVAMEMAGGVQLIRVGDQDFDRLLSDLGLNRSLLVTLTEQDVLPRPGIGSFS